MDMRGVGKGGRGLDRRIRLKEKVQETAGE